MHGNGEFRGKALCEIITLQKTRKRIARREADEPRCTQSVIPLAVVAHFSLREIQHKPCLIKVRLRINLDLLGRKRRTRHVAARGVADGGRKVTDQKDHGVPEVLQLPQFI